jgi:hypothetical protein
MHAAAAAAGRGTFELCYRTQSRDRVTSLGCGHGTRVAWAHMGRAGPGWAGQQACTALPGHLCPSDSAFKGRLRAREPAREPSSGSDASPHVPARPRTPPHVWAIDSCELGHGDNPARLQEQRPGLTQTRPGSAAGMRAATRIRGATRLRAKLARAAGRRSHSRWASTAAPPPRLPPPPFSRGAGGPALLGTCSEVCTQRRAAAAGMQRDSGGSRWPRDGSNSCKKQQESTNGPAARRLTQPFTRE